MLGLNCTPNLKQQLLRTLRSTPDELAAFEPLIAAAFDTIFVLFCYTPIETGGLAFSVMTVNARSM